MGEPRRPQLPDRSDIRRRAGESRSLLLGIIDLLHMTQGLDLYTESS